MSGICERFALKSGASLAAVSIWLVFAGGAVAGGLPTGGQVQYGKGKISEAGASLTVKQSSTFGIVTWKSFSIGKANSVQFNNGSGATLNQVTGSSLSTIAGNLHATGSVFLMNSQGVIISGTGKIVTGGSFVATSGIGGFPQGSTPSTDANLNVYDANKKVVNEGSIVSKDGDAILIGNTAENTGSISAKKGVAGVIAANGATIRSSTDSQPVTLISGTGNATNSGTLTGSSVALEAEKGGSYADVAGKIHATGAKGQNAEIWVVSASGRTEVESPLVADYQNGLAATITTSGKTVALGGTIDAGKHGQWMWSVASGPVTVNAAFAQSINSALANGTSVDLDNVPSQKGNIIVAAPLSWSTGATLTLDSYGEVVIKAPISVTGGGKVSLTTALEPDSGGTLYLLPLENGASIDFGSQNHGGALTINGTAFTLLYNMQDVQNINNNLSGDYALAAPLNAQTTASWIPLGTDGAGNILNGGLGYDGTFEGLGNTISHFSIDRPNTLDTGLFGYSNGVIRDVGMIDENVTGSGAVGGIAGFSRFVIQSYTTGTVTGSGNEVGGISGENTGTVSDSYSTAAVTGRDAVGGLVGDSAYLIENSYATGNVRGAADPTLPLNGAGGVGGLVGFNADAIEDSYATGTVSGGSSNGGLVGSNLVPPSSPVPVTTDSYWDTQTSGLSSSYGGTGLTTAQLESGLPRGFSSVNWSIEAGKSLPYLIWQAPGTGSRPAATNLSDDAIARATQAAAGQIATSEDAFVSTHDRRLRVGENL
jgi:filamentous hemagglutinin family protein